MVDLSNIVSDGRLADVFSRFGDDESKRLYNARVNLSITNDVEAYLQALDKENYKWHAYDLERFLVMAPEYRGRAYIIFGAGKGGKRTFGQLQLTGYEVAAFCDNNVTGKCCGKPVIDVNELNSEVYRDLPIIIAVDSYQIKSEIYIQLIQNDINYKRIVMIWLGSLWVYQGAPYFDLKELQTKEDEVYIDAGAFDGQTIEAFIEWKTTGLMADGGGVY